ncbi:MAG TPA: type II secretion system major pseudopilin GspG [Stellaceae bacterium]|nr:type II secretion system major pseudopilin GspG [Stellaceae bacterium]
MRLIAGKGARPTRRLARRLERGFTLVELLVVLAILALLVAITTPQVLKYLARAKVDTARIEIKNLATALDLFLIDVGRYPTQQEGLQALVANPGALERWHGPYVKATSVPLDPWGHSYQYRIPGQQADFDLYTLGPDGNAVGPASN